MADESLKDSVLQIRVLGPGCPNCQKFEREAFNAVAELEVAADLDHVRDVRKITEYGVTRTPALVINGQVKSVGQVLSREQIKKFILEEIKGK
ncbi:MAG: thioredoxin family protein [Deltaproteobacteria bacterium]|nr:thioredoxin family protein [Deltaproteobacteria bacterium]